MNLNELIDWATALDNRLRARSADRSNFKPDPSKVHQPKARSLPHSLPRASPLQPCHTVSPVIFLHSYKFQLFSFSPSYPPGPAARGKPRGRGVGSISVGREGYRGSRRGFGF
ncbi:hypothetical protein CNBJ0470 [Cryptococcus deneoformans B-3501A]|uniref:Uncharacterized protein n=1 Tax=Cryptococcus deneoformans (strain JEC21 / ATCC MYA-565) TaxID=214684 RepID=Q5KA51_CRYD1|nr:hypothetical protein CNJ03050 [Cryptococcus neoformans var. neoformans JEC21]XP_773269.1 hypothetical protein CNBJ0470 [Cryptococcus neoformans var. neoformans B-3501A]AAW45924.1 hypothetical protein CNJ03050 [Cryptococcus neoformans var. neoformans JEC21]EAL18622.1 hypothetical protein CNBJ0470 [Cryptococcus neoformans var. neoformans B-3501A]